MQANQEQVLETLDKLRKATQKTKWEGNLWLVGGYVRDGLLGRKQTPDVDLVLEGDALELARSLYEQGVSSIEPVVYPRFGTAMVYVGGVHFELATARRESYESRSRKPKVESATLLEDAKRRDFTVNALMRNLHSDELWDPLGLGLDDLKNRILRTPLEPKKTFHDDPLRMLRAVRFRWQLGFQPAPGLYDAIRTESNRLKVISSERIQGELVKMLVLPTANQCLQDLLDLNLLPLFAPELTAMVGVEQGRYHHLDVWHHTLLVIRSAATADLALALACLLHDVGKPATRFIDDKGQTRFFGHEGVGADIARNLLRRLKFSNEVIDEVCILVKNHMRFIGISHFSTAAARRLLRDLGPLTEKLLLLVEADMKALKPGIKTIDLEPIKKRLTEVSLQTPREMLESPLSGEEIMSILHLEPGPEIGHLKQLLCDKVLEGELAPGDKKEAKKILKFFAAQAKSER